MKSIVLVGIFAAVLLAVEAAPPSLPLLKIEIPKLESKINAVLDQKTGPFFDSVRQTLNLLATITERADYDYYCLYVIYYLFYEDSSFLECYDIIEEIADSESPSHDSVIAFCNSNCGTELLEELSWMDQSCGLPLPNATVREVFQQSCMHGPYDQTCMEVWAGYVDTADLPDQGEQCLDDARAARTCPTSCKAFLPWESKHYGCCIKAVLDATPWSAENIAFLDARRLCNYKDPIKLCVG